MKVKANEILLMTAAQHKASCEAHAQLEKIIDPRSGLTMADFVTARPSMEIIDGVASIHITGSLANNAENIHEIAGGTDYKSIISEIDQAKAEGASEIHYKINSGGGSVQGLKEASNAIKASGIPSAAIVDGTAASAAYYLAASTDYIEATPSSIVGNIGTIMAFVDVSDNLSAQGVKQVAIVNEGADLKGTGSEKMTEAQHEFLQNQVNAMGADFRGHVEATREEIDAEVFRAGWYSGNEAKSLGLIDSIS